ncbi:hypothetical protein IHE44_0004115, partial [Lamprotornis superbus]
TQSNPGDRTCCLSPAQTSLGRERPDFPLSRQVTIGGFIDPRKQSLRFVRAMLVMNAASGSRGAVSSPTGRFPHWFLPTVTGNNFLMPFNAAARGSRWGWRLKLSQTGCFARIASSG